MGFWKQAKPSVAWEDGMLEEAVNSARLDWQQAQHLMEISEPDHRLEDAIYYLELTEKRYMFLLSQLKREREHHQA